jgi:hypothetical protein
MIRLFYVSTASLPFDEDDLQQLVAAAAARNETIGVTGALVFNGVNFAQVLEGDQSTVSALMDAIRSDDRHSGVVVIGQRPVTKRQWDGWSMRLVKGLAFDPLLASMSSD